MCMYISCLCTWLVMSRADAGLHYNMMDELRRDMEQLSAILPRLIEQIGATLIWRETTPQHFNTPTGAHSSKQATAPCTKILSSPVFNIQNIEYSALRPAPADLSFSTCQQPIAKI